jgi:hypothetical protein
MSRVVLDVSLSLDGFTAGPNMREAEPMGTAANASTPGWPAAGPTARSMSPCAEHWTPVLAPRSSAGGPWISVSALGRHAVARCAQRCGHASGEPGPARRAPPPPGSAAVGCGNPTVRWGEQAELITVAKPVTGTHLHYRVRY